MLRQLLVLLALQVQALERAGRLEVVRVDARAPCGSARRPLHVAEHVLADLRGLHVQERRRTCGSVDLRRLAARRSRASLRGVVGRERHALELRLRRVVRRVFAERARVGVDAH